MDENGRAEDKAPALFNAPVEYLARAEFSAPQPKSWQDELPRLVALAIAAALHLVLLILIMPAATEALGEDGRQIESIAVSVVFSVPSAVSSQQAAPKPATTEIVPDTLLDSGEERPLQQEEKQAIEKSELTISPEPEPAEPAPITLPLAEPESVKVVAGEDMREPIALANAATVATQPPPMAAAPASVGAIQAYAKQVALALDKSRPKGVGISGTVKVRFLIDLNGMPASADVVASSGKPQLDVLAIAAIRRNGFPRPPPGSTDAERTFVVPYNFR